MFRNKKKGNILENKFAKFTMRFVFAFLSFFFVLTGKGFAQKIKYKYVFDVGEGHKFVYTVEEETNYQVTNPNRYKIINKELQGWSNSVIGYEGGDALLGEIYMKDAIGCDLGQDSQKTIYNWCTYLQKKTDSAASRKFMKSLLIMFMEQGYTIKLADSGNKYAEVNYLWKSQQQNASDAVNDNDYPYVWYRDTYFLNCDFKEVFDSKSGTRTPYNRTYLNGNHIYLKKDAGPISLSDKLCSDKTVLSYINLAIENGTQTGAYFQTMKQEMDTTRSGDALVWWYREGSYNETERSILVDCAKNKGDTPLFTFKYSATGELLEDPFYQLRTNENNVSEQFKQFEYYLNVSDDRAGNTILVYPDWTGGSKKSCKSKFKTGTSSKEQTGSFYLACNGLSFAQTGEPWIYVTSFLPDNFKSISKVTGTSYGDKVCSVPAADLNAIILELGGKLDDGLLIKENNGYVFAFDKETGEIHFYKKDDPAELTYIGMNMNIKQMYGLFVTSSTNNTYGISLKADPTGRNNKSFKNVWTKLGYNYQDRLNVLTTANNREVFDEKNEKYTTEWSFTERKNAMFYNLYKDSDIDCLLSVRDLSGIAESCRGDHDITTIHLQDCPVIAEVSIRDWLEFEYKAETEAASKRAKIASEGSSLASALKSLEDTREEMVPFVKLIYRYARPVILFLFLIAVCMTAIYSILYHNDPEKRMLVKIRLKNIAVGIIFFSISALIVALCIEYFDKAADMMFAEEKDFDLNIVSPYSMDKNWLLKLILNVIGVAANAIKWVIDFLATRLLRLSEREVNLATCIFQVDRGGGITLYPFDEKEWAMYMFGYRLLTIISIAFISVAIVKSIIMILIDAGNAEKIGLVKQDFLRIFIAIMCVIFVPYGVRVMLTICNSMVQLIPVSASMFNLDFSTYNELEPVCNLIYYIIEIKVYLAFTVRKVMIAFLLIATPAIFGIWAISDKFRSFNLWLGEMFTNIFMQFTYGFAFFFLVMIISNNKNPLVLLMMLSMLIKLADFVKDSLQGVFNQWGGINETGVANQAYNTLANAPSKAWGIGKKVTNNVGNALVKGSQQYDKTGTTVAGKRVYNAGMILMGKPGGIRTERERLEAIKNRNKSGIKKKLDKQEAQLRKEIETEMPGRGNVNTDRMYQKAKNGTLTQDEIDNLRKEGGLSAKIADFASTRNEISANEKEMKALGDKIDKLEGLSMLQGSVSKETLANLKAQSKEKNNNVAEIYEHTLDDFDKLEDKMKKSIDKIEDPSTASEDRTKEEANLKSILEQVIDKAQIISEVSVELNMTGGTERMEKIRKAQSSAVREKANRFDKELKTEAMDSIQATLDNLETLENREKNGEDAPKIVLKKSE